MFRPPLSCAALFAAVALLSPAAATAVPALSAGPRASPKPRTVVATISDGVTLHRARSRKGVARLGARTEFGSRTRVPVVRRRGRWLGVVSSALPNGRIGWIRDTRAVARRRTAPVRLVVDRSRARLTAWRGRKVLRRVPVGLGRRGSPTPLGRFAVTDKLPGAAINPVYGCCILALSGRQHRLPIGWTGGNRLAIHGAEARRSSAGCVVVPDRALRHLMREVPVGAMVVIRP
jgi:lipoprotein-anchoring transpeptidase ErfK/SrfK